MKNRLLILIGWLLTVSNWSCRSSRNDVHDFAFMAGIWNSAGTDSYEQWVMKGKVLCGVSYRLIENKLTKVDSMVLVAQDGQPELWMHLRYSARSPARYIWHEKDSLFINNTQTPHQVRYHVQPGRGHLLVEAGEDLIKQVRSFQFLYVPSVLPDAIGDKQEGYK